MNKLNKSCGYEGAHFGATYNDATCINGRLWDLDSIDNGMLTSGGDAACPKCNTEEYLRDAATDLNEGISGNNTTNVPIWSSIVSGCRELNPEGTETALRAIGKVSIISNFSTEADEPEYRAFIYE
ncbi:hypothetical protein [Vibrio sp. ER1A]|uniref:hypothetical protein n=1 Tax=Vibrio sp. ER1A TaxID=1517681 RepID=UPI0005715033|nr:hypothetical protein [Vibrio sp. ER1A]